MVEDSPHYVVDRIVQSFAPILEDKPGSPAIIYSHGSPPLPTSASTTTTTTAPATTALVSYVASSAPPPTRTYEELRALAVTEVTTMFTQSGVAMTLTGVPVWLHLGIKFAKKECVKGLVPYYFIHSFAALFVFGVFVNSITRLWNLRREGSRSHSFWFQNLRVLAVVTCFSLTGVFVAITKAVGCKGSPPPGPPPTCSTESGY